MIKYLRLKVALGVVFLILPNLLKAQNQTVVLPTTPEAASLHKFVDIPVDLNSGIPNVSIDLFELKFRDFTLPININYHSSGIKVSEISSNIGAGWSLNAGGLISANVNNVPDVDSNSGYLQSQPGTVYDKYVVSGFDEDDINGADPFDDHETLDLIAKGQNDGEPDLFYYNFMGRGGNFVFDETHSIRLIPYSSSSIQFENNRFKITDERGVVYEFIQLENAEVRGVGSGCPLPDWFNGFDVLTYTPTWHLKSIVAPNGDFVTFEYENVNYSYNIVASQSDSYYMHWVQTSPGACSGPADMPIATCLNQVEVQGKRIVSINTSNGYHINFAYNPAEREDLPGTNALQQIDIHNGAEVVKSWSLSHSYFGEANSSSDSKKLKLLSIEEAGKPPHSFEYNENHSFPSRLSYDLDHWGYYNGKNNQYLVPRTRLRSEWLAGGNREPDSIYSKLGILTSIVYPTGGSTEFEYEQNEYWFEGSETVYSEKSSPKLEVTSDEIVFPSISTSFTVAGSGWATIDYNIQYNDGGSTVPPPGNLCFARLSYEGELIKSVVVNDRSEEIIFLSPGVYEMELETTSEGFFGFYQINWNEEENVLKEENRPGGGLRVKKIIDKASSSLVSKVRKFSYSNPSNELVSSGIHHNKIAYTYSHLALDACVPLGSVVPIEANHYRFVRVSSSTKPVQNIRYQFVTTLHGESGENGKTVDEFYRFDDKDLTQIDRWPFVKPISYKWQDGLLKESSKFRFVGGSYELVEKDGLEYEFNNDSNTSYSLEQFPNLNNVLAVQVTTLREELISGGLVNLASVLDVEVYWHISAWYYLKSHTKTRYDISDPLKTSQIKTTYYYNNPDHIQITNQATTDSEGKVIETKFKYPLDYASPSLAIDTMINRHIIAPVIEQSQWIKDGTDSTLVSATATEYSYNATDDLVLPKHIHLLETDVPLASGSYSTSADGQTFDNDLVQRATYHQYDEKGNILEFSKEDDVSSTYLWGYNQTYPVAQIVNATYAQAIAELAPGDLAFLQGNTLSDTQIRSKIDLIRQGLPDAQVTCYTYDPLVGMTSQTDPRGKTVTYEYDDLNRLKLVRDHNTDIVQKYEYAYGDDAH